MKTEPITSFLATGPEAPELEPLFEFEKVLSGDPKQSGFVTGTDPSGKFVTGIWACQPGKYVVDPYHANCYEFGYILEGKVCVTDSDGNAGIYQAGDTIVTPKGFKGTWEVLEPIRKVFAVMNT